MVSTTAPKRKKPTTKPEAHKTDSGSTTPATRKPMTDEAISKALKKLKGWTHSGDVIQKTYAFGSYTAGLAFVSTVGMISESFDHHPEILVQWRKVTVSFCTHDAGNKVTPTDIKVAEALEALPLKD